MLFYLHPTPLRSTHRCSVGTFSLTAERRRTHVHVVECVHKGVEIFLVEDEGVCVYLCHSGGCVRMH